jgi:hypothetical protein
VRKWIYIIVTNNKFETLVMLVIVLSSIKLIYDTYIEDLPETDPMVSNL